MTRPPNMTDAEWFATPAGTIETLRQQLAEAKTQIAQLKKQIIALEHRVLHGCPLLPLQDCPLKLKEPPTP